MNFSNLKISFSLIVKTSIQLIILSTSILLCSTNVKAEEVYPTKVPNRFLGSDQGPFGSCWAESEIAAMEHVFARIGSPVQLSTFYRHARNWVDQDTSKVASTGLIFSDQDRAAISRAGALVPDYMFPEDLSGVLAGYLGKNHPEVSAMALLDPNFQTAESLGFVE